MTRPHAAYRGSHIHGRSAICINFVKRCIHFKKVGYIAKKKTHISPQIQRLFWYQKLCILKILGIFCDWLSYAKIIRFGWSHVFIYIAYYRHFKNIIDLNLIATLTNPSLSRHKTYKILVKILTKFSLKFHMFYDAIKIGIS